MIPWLLFTGFLCLRIILSDSAASLRQLRALQTEKSPYDRS